MVEGKIIVIGDELSITGFKLAGVQESYIADSAKQAEELLNKFLSDQSIGIIIILDKLLDQVDWKIKRKIEQVAKPIVVAIPSKDGPIEEEVSLAKLIKRALGFDILNSNKK
ncbi:MAG: V-type ATP synthase subunit F [Candidatus Anstonellaceae archaeon]